MINLLEETSKAIEESNHTPEDIKFIGKVLSKQRCSWDEFKVLADRLYDNGYGGAEIDRQLVIVFYDNNWLERAEYDGSEWWEYRHVLELPLNCTKLTSIFE